MLGKESDQLRKDLLDGVDCELAIRNYFFSPAILASRNTADTAEVRYRDYIDFLLSILRTGLMQDNVKERAFKDDALKKINILMREIKEYKVAKEMVLKSFAEDFKNFKGCNKSFPIELYPLVYELLSGNCNPRNNCPKMRPTDYVKKSQIYVAVTYLKECCGAVGYGWDNPSKSKLKLNPYEIIGAALTTRGRGESWETVRNAYRSYKKINNLS